MKKWVGLICFCLVLLNCRSQYSALRIGDKIPDIYFGKLFKRNGSRLSFSEFKGKLFILDFWNIHCANCIISMPRIDSLQHLFKDRVQFIFITRNDEREVSSLFGKIKIKKPDVPFIVEDRIFSQLFPHNGDPLHVWIDSERVVRAITFDYNTNSQSIAQYLIGIDPHLSRRWDYGIDSDYPLLSERNSSLMNSATDYSILFKGLYEFSNNNFVHVSENSISMLNAPLINLYKIAFYKDVYGFPVNIFNLRNDNRLVITSKDKGRFFFDGNINELALWVSQNQYSYELRTSNKTEGIVFKLMQEDLRRLLPYKPKIEKIKSKCLSLEVISGFNKIVTIDTAISSILKIQMDNSLFIQNKNISSLVSQLIYSNPSLPIPIIDRTGYSGRITITIRSKLSDIQSLNEELKTVGLELVEKEIEINTLVISD